MAQIDTPRRRGFRMPAEWEKHEATWLAWPHERSDWPGKFEPVPAEFAAFAREQAPVEILGFKKPILEVRTLDVNDAAETTGGNVGAHLENGGIEADVVIDGENLFWVAGGFADELGGFLLRHGERFFADDVFAGAEGGEGLGGVFFVG